jgi:hypothetical protein
MTWILHLVFPPSLGPLDPPPTGLDTPRTRQVSGGQQTDLRSQNVISNWGPSDTVLCLRQEGHGHLEGFRHASAGGRAASLYGHPAIFSIRKRGW